MGLGTPKMFYIHYIVPDRRLCRNLSSERISVKLRVQNQNHPKSNQK